MAEEKGGSLELEYPCQWQYKVIGQNKNAVHFAIQEIFNATKCTIAHSNKSKTGKYHSFSITLQVSSESDRLKFYKRLKDDQNIMIVM